MVGTNPYLVVALRRRCTVCACVLLRRPRAVCPCCCVGRLRSVRACMGEAASAVCNPSVLSCVQLRVPRASTLCGPSVVFVLAADLVAHRLPRSPMSFRPTRAPAARSVDLGRLYPGGGKQWSAPAPTLLWRCAVGPVCRLGRKRSVPSISDVYTQEVGNNGRHQPLPCCGVAPSFRSAASDARSAA